MIEANLKQLSQRIDPQDRVLDVGGWHAPLNRADCVIDIMPYSTRNRRGAVLTDIWPTEKFSAESYIQQDICQAPWPFKDKEFDFVVCSHTLEDIRDPLTVCSEIVRVGKAGYIEVPSRLVESTKGVERPFYCGYYHHRWLCEYEDGCLRFLFKPAMLHAYRRFHFRKRFFQKVNPKYEAIGFFWEGNFQFEEKIVIDRNAVQSDLLAFRKKYSAVSDLFVSKYRWV